MRGVEPPDTTARGDRRSHHLPRTAGRSAGRPVPRLKAALNAAGSVLYVFIELLAVARTSRLKELTTWCILSGLGLGFLTDGILVATGA